MNLQQFQQMDSHLLVSLINMKLRNEFKSLHDLARYYDIDQASLCEKLGHSNYHYQSEINQFRHQTS